MSAVIRWVSGETGRTWGWLAVFLVALVIAVALGIQTRGATVKRIAAGLPASGAEAHQVNDLDRFLELVRGFLHDRKDYEGDGFPNPPIVIALLAPLTLLSNAEAQWVWALCKPFMAVAILWMIWRMIRREGRDIHPLAMGAVLFTLIWPYVRDVQNGQTNLLMLLPLVAGLSLAQRGRTSTDIPAGLLLALATAIKITPLVFLLYFLWRGRWIVAASMLLGLVLWFFAIPGLIFGWEQNLLWLRQWMAIMILPYTERGAVVYTNTQSVASFLTRWLSHTPAFQVNKVDRHINLADLSMDHVKWLTRFVLAAIGAAGLIWLRPGKISRRYTLEVGCVAAFMLWASERTWVHHYVTAAILLMAAAALLSDERTGAAQRGALVAALALMAVGMSLTSDLGKVFGPQGPIWAQAYGACLIPSMLLAGTVCFAAGSATRNPSGREGFTAVATGVG